MLQTLHPHPRLRRTGTVLRLAAFTCTLGACAVRGSSSGLSSPAPADSATAAAIASERAGARDSSATRTIGVTPFRLTGESTTLSALSFALADLLATDLARSSQLQLVERSRLSEVLRELDLVKTGRVDSATAPRVGQLLRAERLLLGGLDTLSNGDLRLSVRIADVETGVIQAAIDGRAPLNDVLAAEKAVAFRLFDALGVVLTPAERARIEERRAPSLGALTAYGRGVEADLRGDPRRAADEFRRAATIDPSFGAAIDRAAFFRAAAAAGVNANVLTPGARGIEAPVGGVVDRLNRPLDLITNYARPLPGPGDPAFPGTMVTVVIVINRP
jgi:TolB-like protein